MSEASVLIHPRDWAPKTVRFYQSQEDYEKTHQGPFLPFDERYPAKYWEETDPRISLSEPREYLFYRVHYPGEVKVFSMKVSPSEALMVNIPPPTVTGNPVIIFPEPIKPLLPTDSLIFTVFGGVKIRRMLGIEPSEVVTLEILDKKLAEISRKLDKILEKVQYTL